MIEQRPERPIEPDGEQLGEKVMRYRIPKGAIKSSVSLGRDEPSTRFRVKYPVSRSRLPEFHH